MIKQWLICGLFLLALIGGSVPVFAQGAAIGQVVWVKGNVQAISADQVARALQRRSPIYEKDTVITDPTSTGQITFTDGTLLSLRVNTSIVISQYQHGANTPPEQDSFITNVVKGGFRTVTGVISKDNPKGYQVTTPLGVIGVHGTVYDLLYNPITAKLSVGISEGSISIKSSSRAAPVVLTQGTQNIAAIVSAKGVQIMTSRPPELKSLPQLIPAVSIKPVGPAGVVGPSRGTPGKNKIEVSPCP